MHFAMNVHLEKTKLEKVRNSTTSIAMQQYIHQHECPIWKSPFSLSHVSGQILMRYKELLWKLLNCRTNISLLTGFFSLLLQMTIIQLSTFWRKIKRHGMIGRKTNAENIHFVFCTLYKMLLKYGWNAKPNVPFVAEIWALSQEAQRQKGSWLLGSIWLMIGLKARLQLASCPLE